MLRNIVVGVDGSSSGRKALEWAVDAATEEVHAVHATLPALELLAAVFQVDSGPLTKRLTSQLENVWTADLQPGNTKTFTHLVEDSPVAALMSIADTCNADAIAVGERGQSSPSSSKMVGATVSHLTHLSSLPTVVVPSITQIGNRDRPEVIVIGVTGNQQDDAELVSWACRAAHDSNTRVDLVSSNGAHRSTPRQTKKNAGFDPLDLNQIDAWLERQHYSNPCHLVAVDDDPITALIDASQQAALIVVGSHRSSRLAAYLTGALANHLPSVSQCPVAIVPLTARRP
ncbi:MAG: universal stress protein [Ilumatobacteraceae bacterium]